MRTINLKLGIAMTLNPRTRPIPVGTVKGDGIELFPTVLCPSKMFWRQLKSPTSASPSCRSHEQGLTRRVIPIENVFSPNTMDM